LAQVVSLDAGLGTDRDGAPIRGHVVVVILCADCSKPGGTTHPIAKVLADKHGRIWLNAYAAPGADYVKYRVDKQIPAARLTVSSLLSQTSADRSAWCDKHSSKQIEISSVFAALARSRNRGNPARMIV
jgi:hypothetical protein